MKNIIFILYIFPFISFGQGFNQPKQGKDTTHTFILRSIADTFTTKSDTVINRIDSTNKILSKFYFESCGASIPSNFLGYKFDNSFTNGIDIGGSSSVKYVELTAFKNGINGYTGIDKWVVIYKY